MTDHSQVDPAPRPLIYVSEADHAVLSALVGSARGGQPGPTLLREELDRAVVLQDDEIPPGVSRLGSVVRYLDGQRGTGRTVRLTLPAEADLDQGRISVFSPIGAALLGIARGQVFSFIDGSGQVRTLRILDVLEPAEAES
jgi:regulator of nucleoside diphosphate kinase